MFRFSLEKKRNPGYIIKIDCDEKFFLFRKSVNPDHQTERGELKDFESAICSAVPVCFETVRVLMVVKREFHLRIVW